MGRQNHLFTLSVMVAVVAVQLTLSKPFQKGQDCDHERCKLPDCRCWNDGNPPGNRSQPPLMVMLSFEYAFTEGNVDNYLTLFDGIVNPNGCKGKGTFFVQKLNSETKALKKIIEGKHELAVNSANGIIPNNVQEWKDSIKSVLDRLEEVGVPGEKIKGLRSPQLFCGGNDQFKAMQEMGLLYDSSNVNVQQSAAGNLLWPYTLDNITDTPPCSIGKNINESFPGIWEIPVPVLDVTGFQCPTPSGCPFANTSDTVFALFYKAFQDHLSGKMEPFTIDIDSMWVTKAFARTGTKSFLEVLGAVYPNVYLVSMSDALSWIQNPDMDMDKFGCDKEELKLKELKNSLLVKSEKVVRNFG